MFNTPFQHDSLRQYIVVFGSLLNNISINRQNSAGENVETIQVPIAYGPKEKFLSRVDANPDLNNPIAITLPRISFELKSISYDSSRKLNTIGKITSANSSVYNPVPYDLYFEVSIMVKNIEDGTRIVEQILPFFTPLYTVSIKNLTEMGFTKDIPIILNSTNLEDRYEGDFENRRALIWTLQFTLKGYLFGPVSNSTGIIREIDLNLIANSSTYYSKESVVIKPGFTSTGQPTSNALLSIPSININKTDNYGFIITVTSVTTEVGNTIFTNAALNFETSNNSQYLSLFTL